MNFNGISKFFRISLLTFLASLILFMPMMVVASELDDLLDEQSRLEEEIRRNQLIIDNQGQAIKDLQGQLGVIDAQIAEAQANLELTETKIKITEEEIVGLEQSIQQKETELGEQKNILWAGIFVLYKESDTSMLETLFSSENFSDIVNRNFYLSTIEDQVVETMDAITKIKNQLAQNKKDLELKKTDLVVLAERQKTESNNLRLDKDAKGTILAQTQGEQQQYKSIVDQLQKEHSRLSQEIYSIRKKMGGDEGSQTGGSGGYPYTQIHAVDPWMFLTRECTSYSAWYWNMVLGKSWHNTRPGQGSAWNWPALAYDQGYSVSQSPQIGAIVSWGKTSYMPYGHVAIVRAVNSNGTIDVSEYNWTVPYGYSYRTNVNPWAYGTPRFIY